MREIDTYNDDQLAELPLKNGFRQRGMEMTRLETFTDAAFAFAVTLLVVGGGDAVPSNLEELRTALYQVPAFAASFANIMLFWYAHHTWSRRFGLDDKKTVLISLMLIFVVLVYVYPLKATYSGAIEFASNGYFVSFFELTSYAELRSLFLIFGIGYAALSSTIALLYRHALSVADRLALNELEHFDSATDYTYWTIQAGVAIISVVLAVTLPDRFVVISGLFYAVFVFLLPWYGIRRNRLRRLVAD